MRFEVPQFIDVEDKIVGPFTWRQFVYIAGGAGILVTLWLLLDSFFLFILIGLPIGALAASLAFQKVNNRPFSVFLESFFTYLTRSKVYLWKKDAEQEIVDHSDLAPELPAQVDPSAFVGRSAIKMLARKLEGGTEPPTEI
jgi:hypothetical protein